MAFVKNIPGLNTEVFNPKGLPFGSSSEASFDPDAQAWIDRMVSPSSSEQAAINTFVVAEKAAGNWTLYDEFFCLALGNTNSLVGAKSKIASASGGITWDSDGALFNGTNGELNANFIPSIDGNNFTSNNALIGVYVKTLTLKAQSACGVSSAVGGETAINGNLSPNINVVVNNGTSLIVSQNIQSDSIYVAAREDANNSTLYENGIEIGTIASTTTGSGNSNMYIGVLNFFDIIRTGHFSGKLSSFIIGGESGFNQSSHNTNVRNLITDLSS